MIPRNITRDNILSAIRKIDFEGVPEGRNSRKFILVFNGKDYPPKYVLAVANKFANGYELESSVFNGGIETNYFLTRMGFEIRQYANQMVIPPKTLIRSVPGNKSASVPHNERCTECKRTIEAMLRKIYGEVKCGYQFNEGVFPEDYSNSPFYSSLNEIFSRLQSFRGHADFVRTHVLPQVDYYVPDPGFILEFDESQHFTASRKESLMKYPGGLKTGFNVDKWMELCERYDAKDNDPLYRDEQRAWYDTLRDFLPSVNHLLPTIRLYSKDFKWCTLNPELKSDLNKFLGHIENKKPQWTIKTNANNVPVLARIIISGEWEGDVEPSRKLLNEVCDIWPENKRVSCLVTCAAFLNFEWPKTLNTIGDNKNPNQSVINTLIDKAKPQINQLLTPEIKSRLLRFTDYITIGIDSYKDKISLSSVSIRHPHAELVVVADLKTGDYFWTGKSYPTAGQEMGLVRFTDLSTHFLDLSFGKVLVLGCHDLNIFSPRGEAVTQTVWRKNIRTDFYDMVRKEKPEVVLHHPHTTDSSKIWTAAWNAMIYSFPFIKQYISAGRFFRKEGERSGINEVLANTKQGDTIDFIVSLEKNGQYRVKTS